MSGLRNKKYVSFLTKIVDSFLRNARTKGEVKIIVNCNFRKKDRKGNKNRLVSEFKNIWKSKSMSIKTKRDIMVTGVA